VKRMDKCIHALLRLMRSKMRDRLVKVNKGKWTRHLLGIRNRHKKGVGCDTGSVTVIERNKVYAVQGRLTNDVYLVEQNDNVPHPTLLCPLQCKPCGICVHTFTCTCVDAGLRTTVCKHIHLVVHSCQPVISCQCAEPREQLSVVPTSNGVNYGAPDSPTGCEEYGVEHEEVVVASRTSKHDETDEILQHFRQQETHKCVDTYVAMADKQWSSIRERMQQSADIASGVCEKLARLQSWITAQEGAGGLTAPMEPLMPVNLKVAHQRRYFASTKKTVRKRKPEEQLTKPDKSERIALLRNLRAEVDNISSTLYGTDHDYDARPGDVVAFEHNY